MPIPDVNAWWTAAKQKPGLANLPDLPTPGGTQADQASAWESISPYRSALYDLYQRDMATTAQTPPADQGQGQPPTPAAGLPEGGSALGQMLASLVGTSRTSTSPLAGLPAKVGETNYSYYTSPTVDLSNYTGGTGGGVPPGWVDPTPGANAPQAPSGLTAEQSAQQTAGQTPIPPMPTTWLPQGTRWVWDGTQWSVGPA